MSKLIRLLAWSINQAMLFPSASRTDKPLWPTSQLKGGLALLFRAVELHELGKRHPLLKLGAVGGGGRYWYLCTALADRRYSAEVPAKSRKLLVISELVHQQRILYHSDSRSIPDRSVSLSQAHIRPIVRSKARCNVEFGAKISISVTDNGLTFLDHLATSLTKKKKI